MLDFSAAHFASVMSTVSRTCCLLVVSGPYDFGDKVAEAERSQILKSLDGIDRQFKEMQFSRVINTQYDRLKARLAEPTYDRQEIATLFQVLHDSMITELASNCFLMIPTGRRQLYEQQEPPFGEAVASVFSEAEYDIRHASRCVALDEWTAAVFYLMRAVELALRALAKRLKIKGVNIKEWARLLQDVDSALDAMRQKRRTAKRDRDLEFYSRARASIAGFNEAWRKHVMHARGKYDEDEAIMVYQHVKALTQQLASGA